MGQAATVRGLSLCEKGNTKYEKETILLTICQWTDSQSPIFGFLNDHRRIYSKEKFPAALGKMEWNGHENSEKRQIICSSSVAQFSRKPVNNKLASAMCCVARYGQYELASDANCNNLTIKWDVTCIQSPFNYSNY